MCVRFFADPPRKKLTVRYDYLPKEELAKMVRDLRDRVSELEDQLSRQQHGSVIGQAQQMLADKGSTMLTNLSQALVQGVLGWWLGTVPPSGHSTSKASTPAERSEREVT
jgi:hypothetical protein